MKRLSVIIVTYQSDKDIYDCLQSVWQYNNLQPDELEVIVVDNSPESEPMFTKLRQLYGDDIFLVKNTHNGGYGQGNNIGIRHATAPVCMILNPDVRLLEPVFKTAVEAFEKDEKLCLYGMKQLYEPGRPSKRSFTCTYMMNGYLHTLLTIGGNLTDIFFPRWMYFSGSCFFVNKEKFQTVGLFDESIFMYGEEDDIRCRLYKAFGVHAKYNKHIHYIHPSHQRKPDINYEKKLIHQAIEINESKGYPRAKTIRGRIQNLNMLLFLENIKRLFGHSSKEKRLLFNQRKLYLQSLQEQQ